MKRLPFLFGLLVLSLLAGLAAARQPGKRKPAPEHGKGLWNQRCWMCHGHEAAGDGPAAAALPTAVPDLRGQVERDDFRELIDLIQEGRGAMPGYAATIDRHDSRRILVFLERQDEPAPESDRERDSAEEDAAQGDAPPPEDAPPSADEDGGDAPAP